MALHKIRFNKILAYIDGKPYMLTSVRVSASINKPAAAQFVLGQGMNMRQNSTFVKPGALDKPFTNVVLKVFLEGRKDGIVLFTGYVSATSRKSVKTVAGSRVGTVVTCMSASTVLQAINAKNYRYWGSQVEQKGTGKPTSLGTEQLNKYILFQKYGHLDATTVSGNAQFVENATQFLVDTLGDMIVDMSDQKYTAEALSVHIANRGRTVRGSRMFTDTQAIPDAGLIRKALQAAMNSDPMTALLYMCKSQLLMNLVPLTNGKMDMIPAFPWGKETIGLLKRSDVLDLTEATSIDTLAATVDAVFVPLLFGDIAAQFAEYPETDGTVAGFARVVQMPEWINPFSDKMNRERALKEAPTDGSKKTKTGKLKPEKIDEMQDNAETIAGGMAQAYFNELKNSGVKMAVKVPWYRLEFFDALGYLIEIEQPHEDDEEGNLLGMISAVEFKASSTTAGTQASMHVTMTHVRSDELQESVALDEHPLYDISDSIPGKLSSLLSRFAKPMTASEQKQIAGDGGEDYLNEAEELMKKQ